MTSIDAICAIYNYPKELINSTIISPMTPTDHRHGKVQVTSTGKLLDYNWFKGYSNTLIETGSAAGDGIQRALDAGFGHVLSCEAAQQWYSQCADRFINNGNVQLYFGKSTDRLGDMLDTAYLNGVKCIVIFLDAHPAGPLSAGHAEWVSGDRSWDQDAIIKAELAIILSTRTKHVIIIDDVNGLTDGHAVEYMELIEAAHPGAYEYAFYDENLSGNLLYKDKILVATPKI